MSTRRRVISILLFCVNCVAGLSWQFAWDAGWFGLRTLLALLLCHVAAGVLLIVAEWRIRHVSHPTAGPHGFEVQPNVQPNVQPSQATTPSA